MRSPEAKARQREAIRRWQKANPEKMKEAKKRYYSSEKGKAQKAKEDAMYTSSGGRAKAEARRASKPLSEARKEYRLQYQLMRRSSERNLNELDSLVLLEAVKLAKLRTTILGINWHVDHIVPVSKGGTSSASNLQVVPALWNRQKGNKHMNTYFLINKEAGHG